MAAAYPDAVAWRNLGDDTRLTFREWDGLAARLARGLAERGIDVGDRAIVAIAPDHPFEWLVAYTAVHRVGAVAVPVNTRLAAPELSSIVAHAEPSVILASSAAPGDTSWLALAPVGRSPIVGALESGAGAIGWHELLAEDALDDPRVPADGDVMDIMYTSGTTGSPKAVAVPYGRADLDTEVPAWNGLGFLTASAFPTTSGSLLIHGPMRAGMSGWFLPRFDADTWISVVEDQRPPVAFIVPAMAHLLVAHPRFATADLSGLAALTIGGAPIAPATLQRLGERLPGAEVLVGYGLTEFGAVSRTPGGDRARHLGSVGRALPGVEIRIVDDGGRASEPGETGEVTVRGTDRGREYYEEATATEGAWSEGWLRTGDLGLLDQDGFLWITGRKKDLIIRGGLNVVPGEVEDALYSHPDVVEAAVAGIPHDVLGEDVAAWIVLRGGSTCSGADLRAYLLERLADYKVPRQIALVPSLPRNEAGKVLTRRLVDAVPPDLGR